MLYILIARTLGVLFLATLAAALYRFLYRGDAWRDPRCNRLMSLSVALLFSQLAACIVALVAILLHCILWSHWPSYMQQLVLWSLLIGCFSAGVAATAVDDFSRNGVGVSFLKRLEFYYISSTILGSLSMLSCSWFSIEMLYLRQGHSRLPDLPFTIGFVLSIPCMLIVLPNFFCDCLEDAMERWIIDPSDLLTRKARRG